MSQNVVRGVLEEAVQVIISASPEMYSPPTPVPEEIIRLEELKMQKKHWQRFFRKKIFRH